MKYFVLASPAVILGSLLNAVDFKADLSMGVATNSVHGSVTQGEDSESLFVSYTAPVADLGLLKTINGPLSVLVRVKGELGGSEQLLLEDVGISSDRSIQASLGLQYDLEGSSYYVAPMYQTTAYNFSIDGSSESKELSGLGLVAGASVRFNDYAGVRFNMQHVVNDNVTKLTEDMSNLKTGVTQFSVSIFGDVASSLGDA